MTLTIYEELEQGSDEWHAARCGLMTASELNLILSATLKPADNAKTRSHVYELAAQRITKHVEPTYVGDNMLRGWQDEITARELYSQHYAPVTEVGGMCRDFGGFKLWCSPDGLVGDAGGIETKSRIQKYQIQTVISQEVPDEHKLQVQACMLVSGRDWWDYLSYSGGMPLCRIAVKPEARYQDAITQACESFEAKIKLAMEQYQEQLAKMDKLIHTERTENVMEVY